MSLVTAMDRVPVLTSPPSCVICRRRKVRCDRNTPCSNCVKAKCNCNYPSPGRRVRRKAKADSARHDRTSQSRLLDKVRRLEGIVKDLTEQAIEAPQGSPAGCNLVSDSPQVLQQNPGAEELSPVSSLSNDAGSVSSTVYERPDKVGDPGLLVSSNRGKLYVSGDFWTTLCREVSITGSQSGL
jgi:hypothetical protein